MHKDEDRNAAVCFTQCLIDVFMRIYICMWHQMNKSEERVEAHADNEQNTPNSTKQHAAADCDSRRHDAAVFPLWHDASLFVQAVVRMHSLAATPVSLVVGRIG